MTDKFIFGSKVKINAPAALDCALMRELWHGFCFSASEAEFSVIDGTAIVIGTPSPVSTNGHGCALSVTKDGIYVAANDIPSLIDGYCALLSLVTPISLENGSEQLCVPLGLTYIDRPIARKTVHICVFPETSFFFLKRMIRLAGFLRYTHLVIEFWGTFRFKCLPELAWRDRSFTAEELKPIIDEAKAFGMEIIPDFNHLGHASASRHIYGKHVVLDQNPRLATLFSGDGWAWNLENEKVRPLLKQIRKELCDLCGDGEFFHLGCDECYTYEGDREKMSLAANHLAAICNETLSEGRRPIIWGDMFLTKEQVGYSKTEPYECNCRDEMIAKELLSKLPKDTVIADWQYNVACSPWRSTEYFMANGFDTFVCPWESSKNVASAIETVEKLGAFGLMETTWHHLPKMISELLHVNKLLHNSSDNSTNAVLKTETAALLRKLLPANNYEESGWARSQLEFI